MAELCGRPTKSGAPCRLPAGFRTPFAGQKGYPCFHHGGTERNKLAKKSRELFPNVADEKLSVRAREFAQDANLLSLNREIGIARALLERIEISDNPDFSYANMLLKTIGDLSYLHHKMVQEGKFMLRIDFVQTEVEKIVSILFQNLPNETAQYLSGLIENQLRMPKVIEPKEKALG